MLIMAPKFLSLGTNLLFVVVKDFLILNQRG